MWAASAGPHGILGPGRGPAGVSHGAASTAPSVGPRLFTRALEEGRKPAAGAAQGQLWFTQSSPSFLPLPSLATRTPAPLPGQAPAARTGALAQACARGGLHRVLVELGSAHCESSCRLWHGARRGPCVAPHGQRPLLWPSLRRWEQLGAWGQRGASSVLRPSHKSTSCSPGAAVGKALGLPRSPPSCPAAPERGPCLRSRGCWPSPKVPSGYPAGAGLRHRCPAPPAAPPVQSPATNSFLSSWWLKATGESICLVG